MESSLVINSIDTSGNLKQKTVTYVNPAVTNAKLETFAQKMTAMSTNTYVNSKRLDATSPASELSPSEQIAPAQVVTKPQPVISLGVWNKSGTTYTATISYNGDGTLSSTLGTISGSTLSITDADGIFSGIIMATETDTYAASSLSFTYNTEETSGGSDDRYQPTISNISFNYNTLEDILTVECTCDYVPRYGDRYHEILAVAVPLVSAPVDVVYTLGGYMTYVEERNIYSVSWPLTDESTGEPLTLAATWYSAHYYADYKVYIVVPETESNKAATAVYDPQQQ